MNKKHLFLIVIIFSCGQLFSQGYLPGVNEQIETIIQSEISTHIGENYRLGIVLNVDSCLGSGLFPRWPDIGPIEDPYGTLTNCLVFTAGHNSVSSPEDSVSGIVGIFRNGQIIWHSGNKITPLIRLRTHWIWSIKDINKDGNVEILTTWLSGVSEAQIPLWIISWNGIEGTVINDLDRYNGSVIKISQYGNYSYVDVEGDGIWEIQGENYPAPGDSSRINPETGMVLYTYSWNGNLYGIWPNTPQPYDTVYFPRNRINVNTKAFIQQFSDSIKYCYIIENLPMSLQNINEFAMKRKVDIIRASLNRKYWNISAEGSIIHGWNLGLYGFNYLHPGESDSSLMIVVEDSTLPAISNIYVKGWNGAIYRSSYILEDSFIGFSIGPVNPPSHFNQVSFTDSLIHYCVMSDSLKWITDYTATTKYTGYFENTKSHIQQNNNSAAINVLDSVLTDVDADSGVTLTSEAYALIKYNTEYLKDQITQSHGIPHDVRPRNSQEN